MFQDPQDSQVNLQSQFPPYLVDANDRNVWQPKAVFQPRFSSAACFVMFQIGPVENQPAAARATLIGGACHAASQGNSKVKSKQLEIELKLSRPPDTISPGIVWLLN